VAMVPVGRFPPEKTLAMPMTYSTTFFWNVTAGFLLTLLGAAGALVAGVWWMRTGERGGGEAQPVALRLVWAAAIAMFTIGLFWQLFGYLRLGYAAVG
jgi:hypothetical protein